MKASFAHLGLDEPNVPDDDVANGFMMDAETEDLRRSATAEELREYMSSWSAETIETFLSNKRNRTERPSSPNSSRTETRSEWLENTEQATLSVTMPPGTGRPRTMLEKENSLLVDLGSRISVGGINTLTSLIDEAKQFGHPTKIERRKKRLNVNGLAKDQYIAIMKPQSQSL